MKRVLFFCMSGLLLFSACSRLERAEDIKTSSNEIISTALFSSVDIQGPFIIKYVRSDVHSIRITGNEELLKEVEVSQLGEMVHIALNEGPQKLFVHIEAPVLDAAYMNGAIKADLLNMNQENLKIRLVGAFEVILEGVAKNVTITTSGAGSLDAHHLQAEDVSLEASGATNITLAAEKTLDIKAYGASSISYKGNAVVTTSTAGAARVTKIE